MMPELDKYGVFWYNEAEINHWSDADFEAKAQEFAASGINIVMTFSVTHFRWSFYPWWDKINTAIGRIVRACHKYNIRVVEHHSSHLQFNPANAEQWDDLEVEFAIRHSSMQLFEGMKEYIASGDPEIADGVHLSDCRQIDGRSGDFVISPYAGYALCFNNPHYRKAYLDYLTSVFALGVDGIMTDDVQFYASGNSCTCRCCREKFKRESSFDLPPPEKWSEFSGDYDNPAFIEWLRFRMRSTEEFQRAVSAHISKLGYKLLRPNYATTTFSRNHTAYPLESAADLWSCVFQENMFSAVIRQSWPGWSADAAHRLAMAQRNNVMAMSMFYPDRFDNYYFAWALSKAWNHLLMATPEGSNINVIEQQFRQYDLLHPVIRTPDILTDIAIIQPRSSMDYTADAQESSVRPLMVWSQSAIFRNMRLHVLNESDTLETLLQYPLIVLAGAAMLSDDDLLKLKSYCEGGGRLFIFGKFGVYRPDGTLREHPEEIFGFKVELSNLHPVASGIFCFDRQKVVLPAVEESYSIESYSPDGVKVIAQTCTGEILGVSAMNEHVVYLAGGVISRQPPASHYCFSIPRWNRDPDRRVEAPPYAADYLRAVPGGILSALLKKVQSVNCSSPDYMITAYYDCDQKNLQLHLVNTANMLCHPPQTVSHADILEAFVQDAPASNPELLLTLNLPAEYYGKSQVRAFSPEFSQAEELSAVNTGGLLQIVIPASVFSGYLHLQIN